MLAVSSIRLLVSFFIFFSLSILFFSLNIFNVHKMEEGLEQPGAWHHISRSLHTCGLGICVSASCVLSPRVFPEKSLAYFSAWQWWRQMEMPGEGSLPSCPHCWSPPHPMWTVVPTWNRLRALQAPGTLGLEDEIAFQMCYGYWLCPLTISVLKIPFQRKQPPSFELVLSL